MLTNHQEKEDGASTKVPPQPSSARDANAEDYNQGVGVGGGGFQAAARMIISSRSDMEVHFVVLLLLLLLWSGPSDGGGAKVGGSVSSSSSSSRCRWARDGGGLEEGGGGGGELECTIITPSSSSAESLKVPLGSSASPRTLTVRCPQPQRPLQGDRDSQIRKENATKSVNSPVRSGEGGSSYSDLRAVLEAALSLVQKEEDENAWRHLRHLRFSGCAVRRLRRADLLFAASSLGGAGAVHSLAVEGVPVPMELDEVRIRDRYLICGRLYSTHICFENAREVTDNLANIRARRGGVISVSQLDLLARLLLRMSECCHLCARFRKHCKDMIQWHCGSICTPLYLYQRADFREGKVSLRQNLMMIFLKNRFKTLFPAL